MDPLSTHTKINVVFGCTGATLHLFPGFKAVWSQGKYLCPYCYSETTDMTRTPVGMAYFANTRPDLHSPPPLRIAVT